MFFFYASFFIMVYHQILNVVPYTMWAIEWASLVAQMVKNLPAIWETWVRSLVRKISWGREWQPTQVFLPGEFHAQRSLVEHSSWGTTVHKELGMAERLTLSLYFSCYIVRPCCSAILYIIVCLLTPDSHSITPNPLLLGSQTSVLYICKSLSIS